MRPVTIEDLKKVPAMSDVPDEHLQWILERSEYAEFKEGDLLFKTGDTVEHLWIILEGSANFYMDINGKLVFYLSFGNDERTGGVTGLLPYSRMKGAPGTSYASEHLRVLSLHKKYFSELEHLNPDFIQRLIGYMTDRARTFATLQLQQEKVSALGKLSAGIAHELNNPASAISRISDELHKRTTRNFELTEKLLQHNISSAHIHTIREQVKKAQAKTEIKLSALQRIEKEDEIRDWMEHHTSSDCAPAAEVFLESGFLPEDLEEIKQTVGAKPLPDVLQWLENFLNTEQIIKDLADAAGRISNLVSAIKSHVHMDRTNDVQTTNINEDINNTLTLLGHKIRDKNITVVKKYDDDMVVAEAYVGELNQVWTNIIDNAIYALPQNGELIISTCADDKNVNAKIVDNGSGIPQNIISRIFDPFFTTKKVGDGTGIGLDLVNRIIKKHNGTIKVNSVPGKTEFSICIPIKYVKTEQPAIA
jgi:signal transduction histidine kinase